MFLLLGLACLFAAVDLVTKHLAFSKLPVPDPVADPGQWEVVPGLLYLQMATNRGGLFGLGQGHVEFFIVFSVITVGLVAWMYASFGHRCLATAIALSMILGGALGNLWDRVQHGSVRDFILVYIGPRKWPNFNLADVWICVGVAALVIWLWRHPETGKKATAAQDRVGAGNSDRQK
ncbi:MAG: signal peptidase II [Planctomycetota bacterium]